MKRSNVVENENSLQLVRNETSEGIDEFINVNIVLRKYIKHWKSSYFREASVTKVNY